MFPSRRSRCFLFQAQNHRSVRVTTSRNQQRTKEERSVLLYNNRWICLLPFARKPDPGRVSKQVSRCRAAAGLALWPGSFGAAGRKAPQAERQAPQAEPIQRAAGRKIRGVLRSPCSLRSVFARAALAEQHVAPAARCSQRTARRVGLLQKRLTVRFFFFYAGDDPRGRSTPSPRPGE